MSAGGSLLAASLYPGVPLFWSVWFTMTLVIVIYQFCWKIFLFRRSRRWQKSLLALGRAEGGEASRDQFYWVFMVPALNEEVTIIDSIERLEQVDIVGADIVLRHVDDGGLQRHLAVVVGSLFRHVAGELRRGDRDGDASAYQDKQ